MTVSASLRNESRKPGMAGFYGRTAIVDDLITSSWEKKREADKYKADLAAKTDVTTNSASIASGEKIAALGRESALKQEGMQQEGLTARQKITEAGNMAVQKLTGSQAMERVGAAGAQARKTKKEMSGMENLYAELLKKGGGQGQAGSRAPYQFKPGGGLNIEEPMDLGDLLNPEEW